jgi:acetyl esterase/lipase
VRVDFLFGKEKIIMPGLIDFEDNTERNAKWQNELDRFERHQLWESGAPGYVKDLGQPEPGFIFLPAPDGAGKGCVVVMAGGGYTFKSRSEGIVIAEKLNLAGINAAVLDYRIVPYKKELILADAKRCVKTLYCRAAEFGIDRDKIGVIGFSAGGNLAAMTCFYGDDGSADSPDPVERCPCRPAAAILSYAAVYIVDEPEEDDDDEFNLMSYFTFKPEKDMKFPPAFIWQSFEDMLVNYNISLDLAALLRKMKVPVELHVFPYGEHGQALANQINYTNPAESSYNALTICWSDLCTRWLKYYGF